MATITDVQKLNFIVSEVCKYFAIDKETLTSKTRLKDVVKPRQIAHYLCTQYTEITLAQIGVRVGGKDHATVLHSCRAVKNLIDTKDCDYYHQIKTIEEIVSLAINADSFNKEISQEVETSVIDASEDIIKKIRHELMTDKVIEGWRRQKIQALLVALHQNNQIQRGVYESVA